MSLLAAYLSAPLCACARRRSRRVHAVVRSELVRAHLPGRTAVGACGARRLRLWLPSGAVVPWSSEPLAGRVRCPDCAAALAATT